MLCRARGDGPDHGVKIVGATYDGEDLGSFALTDEALVLARPGWRWPLKFDREEIENPSAVRRALAEYLPEESS